MGGVISFFIFFLLGILDTVFAVKLNLSPWKFLLAGNPRLPDGTRLYDMECFQRAAGTAAGRTPRRSCRGRRTSRPATGRRSKTATRA